MVLKIRNIYNKLCIFKIHYFIYLILNKDIINFKTIFNNIIYIYIYNN